MRIFTSIAPHLKRSARGQDVTDAYLRDCFASWRQFGVDLVSLNTEIECAALRDRFPDVVFQSIDTKIPSIQNFLAAICETNAHLVGIVNCDCLLRASLRQMEWIKDQASRGLVIMERLNFSPDSMSATGISCRGFDAFLFPREAAMHIEISEALRIGQTWWDYEFPLAFIEAGYPLFHCVALLHLDHPLGWDAEQWVRNGTAAKLRFGQMLGDPSVELDVFAERCFDFLRQSAIKDGIIESEMSNGIMKYFESVEGEFNGLKRSIEAMKWATQTEKAKIAYLEGLLHARSQPDIRRSVGEWLCTFSKLLAVFRAAAPAKLLFSAGVDLQRRADEDHMPKVCH